jgi:hypothetical protein
MCVFSLSAQHGGHYFGETHQVQRLLALVVYQTCHASGVAGSDGVPNVSRKWCCWLWWCTKRVTQVVLLALVALQKCHASGVAGSSGVTKVPLKWAERHLLQNIHCQYIFLFDNDCQIIVK